MDQEIKVYKRRWTVLFALCLMNAVSTFSLMCFALVCNFYEAYFGISYVAVDWISIAYVIGNLLASPVLAWGIFSKRIGLRRLAVSSTACLAVAYICIPIAIAFPAFFPLLILGQVISGIAKTMLIAAPSTVAVLWFPENQVGIAIALNILGISIGGILAYLLPCRVITGLKQATNSSNAISSDSAIQSDVDSYNEKARLEDKIIIIKIFGILLCVTVLLLIAFIFALADAPPKPPSAAQAIKRRSEREKVEEKASFKAFLADTRLLLADWTFMVSAVAFGFIYNAVMLDDTMMEQIIERLLSNLGVQDNSDVITSYVMTVYPVGSLVGNLMSGYLVDKFKTPAPQIVIGAGLCFAAAMGTLLGFYYEQLVTIACSIAMLGLCTRICVIPLYDSVIQNAFPQDELFVTMWLTAVQTSTTILIVEVGRCLFIKTGALGALSVQSVVLFIAFILSLFFKPDLKRLKAEQSVQKSAEKARETDILLSDKIN